MKHSILSKKNPANLISVILTGLMSFIFVYKYSTIYLDNPLLSYLYIICYVILIYSISSTDVSRRLNFAFFSVSISFLILIYTLTIPRIGEINRLPAIESWINLFLHGEYPYNFIFTPSAFPFLYYLAMPFYLIGNIGLLVPVGFFIFFCIISKRFTDRKEKMFITVLLMITPFLYYELVVRSELFMNAALLILLIYIADTYLEEEERNYKFFSYTILFGLIASTRSVLFIPMMIYLLYKFRYNIKNLLILVSGAGIIFIALLLPFIIWNYELFNTVGPFAVQSSLSRLSAVHIIPLFITAILCGWGASSLRDVFFTAGLILFASALVSFLLMVNIYGLENTIINDHFDQSYFIFAVPFLLLSIKNSRTDKFTGNLIED